MKMFKGDPPPQYIRVVKSVAGEAYSFATGAILQLAPGARAWPAPFDAWIANRGGGEPIVTVLPPPEPWFLEWANIKVIVIDPATFRTTLPAPPPKAALLDRIAVMKRLGYTGEQFDEALTQGFPAAQITRTTTHWNGGMTQEPLWREDHVEQWAGRHARLAVPRG